MDELNKINAEEWYTGKTFNKIYHSGINKIILKKSHQLLEKNRKKNFYPTTLELGATKGHHFNFVDHKYEKYIVSDIFLSDELIELGKKNPKVIVKRIDANDLSQFKSGELDRVITTCLLQHLLEVEKAIAMIIEKLKVNTGVFDTLLSNTESLMWKIGRIILILPKLIFTKYTARSYFDFYKSDHVNTCKKILKIVKTIKGIEIEISKFPSNHFPDFLTIYYRLSIKKLP